MLFFAQNLSATNHAIVLDETKWMFQSYLYMAWLVGCFGFIGPLRQYFSLYRAVSQREGERGEKG